MPSPCAAAARLANIVTHLGVEWKTAWLGKSQDPAVAEWSVTYGMVQLKPQQNQLSIYLTRCNARVLHHNKLRKCGGRQSVSTYLLDSLDHRLQPVRVDLAVAVQEGQDGGRGRVRSSHA